MTILPYIFLGLVGAIAILALLVTLLEERRDVGNPWDDDHELDLSPIEPV